jgi:hypothetical protein
MMSPGHRLGTMTGAKFLRRLVSLNELVMIAANRERKRGPQNTFRYWTPALALKGCPLPRKPLQGYLKVGGPQAEKLRIHVNSSLSTKVGG